MIKFKTRQMASTDLNFILSSWPKSYRTTIDNRRIVNGIYYPNMSNIVANILKKAQKSIIYNPEPGKDDHIFGYVVYDYVDGLLVLHYIYVKHMYRRLGIMSEMIKKLKKNDVLPVMCTFATDIFDIVKDDHNLMYNPFMR